MTALFVFAASVLALIGLFRSKGTDLSAWAILLLSAALLLEHGVL